jgi:phosphoserine phosphatase
MNARPPSFAGMRCQTLDNLRAIQQWLNALGQRNRRKFIACSDSINDL